MSYVNFNDESIPLGKRKQAFIRWAVSKGTKLIEAQRIANKKFGFAKKKGIFLAIVDYGRMHQNSFHWNELYDYFDERKYEDHKIEVIYSDRYEWEGWKPIDGESEKDYINRRSKEIEKECKKIGWDFKLKILVG